MYNRAIEAIIFSNLNFIKAKRASFVLNCWQGKNKIKQTQKLPNFTLSTLISFELLRYLLCVLHMPVINFLSICNGISMGICCRFVCLVYCLTV